MSQIKRPFKQQRTAITKSSILRVKRDLEIADKHLDSLSPRSGGGRQNSDLQGSDVIQYDQAAATAAGDLLSKEQIMFLNQQKTGATFCNSNMTFALNGTLSGNGTLGLPSPHGNVQPSFR